MNLYLYKFLLTTLMLADFKVWGKIYFYFIFLLFYNLNFCLNHLNIPLLLQVIHPFLTIRLSSWKGCTCVASHTPIPYHKGVLIKGVPFKPLGIPYTCHRTRSSLLRICKSKHLHPNSHKRDQGLLFKILGYQGLHKGFMTSLSHQWPCLHVT